MSSPLLLLLSLSSPSSLPLFLSSSFSPSRPRNSLLSTSISYLLFATTWKSHHLSPGSTHSSRNDGGYSFLHPTMSWHTRSRYLSSEMNGRRRPSSPPRPPPLRLRRRRRYGRTLPLMRGHTSSRNMKTDACSCVGFTSRSGHSVGVMSWSHMCEKGPWPRSWQSAASSTQSISSSEAGKSSSLPPCSSLHELTRLSSCRPASQHTPRQCGWRECSAIGKTKLAVPSCPTRAGRSAAAGAREQRLVSFASLAIRFMPRFARNKTLTWCRRRSLPNGGESTTLISASRSVMWPCTGSLNDRLLSFSLNRTGYLSPAKDAILGDLQPKK